MSLTLATVVHNEAAKIVGLLEHAKTFCDELLVVDQSSTDGTAELAWDAGARVCIDRHHGWPEPSRRLIEPNVLTSHILLLDADERIVEQQTGVFKDLAPEWWGAWLPRRTWIDGVWACPDSDDRQFRWWKLGTVLPFSENLHSYIRPTEPRLVTVLGEWMIDHEKTGAEQAESLSRYERLIDAGVGVG